MIKYCDIFGKRFISPETNNEEYITLEGTQSCNSCGKEGGLTTLETRKLRRDQIEVFKILNGYENIDRNMFFSLKKDSRTRGHEVKLVKDQCRLDIRKHSFSQRTINKWNKLSTDCITASSVNMFKNKVDTYLRRAGYTNMNTVGLTISQWLPCPLTIWAFGLDGKSC